MHDLLREEGDRYAALLRQAGVLREHRVIEGVDHGYTHFHPSADIVTGVLDLIVEHVRGLAPR